MNLRMRSTGVSDDPRHRLDSFHSFSRPAVRPGLNYRYVEHRRCAQIKKIRPASTCVHNSRIPPVRERDRGVRSGFWGFAQVIPLNGRPDQLASKGFDNLSPAAIWTPEPLRPVFSTSALAVTHGVRPRGFASPSRMPLDVTGVRNTRR
jgi:hypothetical protein